MLGKYKKIFFIIIFILILLCLKKVYATTNISFKDNTNYNYNVLFNEDLSEYCILECNNDKNSIYLLDFSESSSKINNDGELWWECTGDFEKHPFYYFYKNYDGRVYAKMYSFNVSTNTFTFVNRSDGGQLINCKISILFSTFDILLKCDNSGLNEIGYMYKVLSPTFYCFPNKEDITLENFKYSQILSVAYSSENYNNYTAQISLDGENWTIMNKEYESLDNSTFIFYCDVFENGTYQVKVFDNNTGLYVYDDVVEVDNIPFSITLEPSEDTNEPIIARTNTFSFNASLKYSVHFSTDKEEWTKLNHSTEAPSETEEVNVDDTYYWTRIFKNGTYYFRFTYYDEEYDENGKLISSTPNYFYVTKKVKNLMVEDYMSDDYIFKPIISLSFNEETQAFIVRTQSILLDKALNLNCFYITYEKTEGFNPNEQIEDSVITGWNKMEIDFENNIYMGTSDAYFYFEIPIINATDTNYKIAFYNYISEKSSEVVYYDFVYKDAKDYVEKDLKAHLGINVRLNDFLKNVESHFGILGFPMTVVRNFCNKILTLQAKEPIIYIPELYEPFYHNKIYNGTSFNFNSLLVNDSVIFIHEFYLIIVDMIFIYLFLVYCVKTLKTFISNITNDD